MALDGSTPGISAKAAASSGICAVSGRSSRSCRSSTARARCASSRTPSRSRAGTASGSAPRARRRGPSTSSRCVPKAVRAVHPDDGDDRSQEPQGHRQRVAGARREVTDRGARCAFRSLNSIGSLRPVDACSLVHTPPARSRATLLRSQHSCLQARACRRGTPAIADAPASGSRSQRITHGRKAPHGPPLPHQHVRECGCMVRRVNRAHRDDRGPDQHPPGWAIVPRSGLFRGRGGSPVDRLRRKRIRDRMSEQSDGPSCLLPSADAEMQKADVPNGTVGATARTAG
jgi:hypothetical protein